jgi:hypothetical protein
LLDCFFECGTFLPQFLRPLRLIPDIRLFEFTADFDQAFLLGIKVKDTPLAR